MNNLILKEINSLNEFIETAKQTIAIMDEMIALNNINNKNNQNQ